MSADEADDLSDHPYFRGINHKESQQPRPWHPLLQALLFAILCLLVLFFLDMLD